MSNKPEQEAEPLQDTDKYTVWPQAYNGYVHYKLKGIAGDHYYHGSVEDTVSYIGQQLAARKEHGIDINTESNGKLPPTLPARQNSAGQQHATPALDGFANSNIVPIYDSPIAC